ncbi:glycoside hydrolase family 11 protein [Sorangium sp. So ce726]|uniref:glycoside hydrolase family 11 protein n=1 Tax=Sorangium sp. So ce726 TaxID=3133319 RepID=UPI003F644575
MRVAPLLGYLSASIACSLLACNVERTMEEDLAARNSALNSADGTMSAEITFPSQWQSGYCANVTVKNTSQQTTTGWRVVVGLNGTKVANTWNATFASSNGQLTASNMSWNGNLSPSASTTFGFCANGSGKPSLVSVSGSGGASSSSSSSSSASSSSSSSASSSSSSSSGTGGGGAGGADGEGGAGGTPDTCTTSEQPVCGNETGSHCGFTYQIWKDQGTGCLTNTADGFSVEWSDIFNLLGGKGLRPGSRNQIVTYEADFQPGGNSWLGVYGWTKSPLVEYHIVDSWGTWRPPGEPGRMGTVTTDGGTYDIYRTQRVNHLSIEGINTYYQFWSVRTQKRTSGTITVANHFDAWEKLGMKLGSLYEVSMLVEGYQSNGRADVSMTMR